MAPTHTQVAGSLIGEGIRRLYTWWTEFDKEVETLLHDYDNHEQDLEEMFNVPKVVTPEEILVIRQQIVEAGGKDPESLAGRVVDVMSEQQIAFESMAKQLSQKRPNLRKIAYALANEAYLKYGERKKSEANLLITRKWMYETIKVKDLRTKEKLVVIDIALPLSFLPSRAARDMVDMVDSGVWRKRSARNGVHWLLRWLGLGAMPRLSVQ